MFNRKGKILTAVWIIQWYGIILVDRIIIWDGIGGCEENNIIFMLIRWYGIINFFGIGSIWMCTTVYISEDEIVIHIYSDIMIFVIKCRNWILISLFDVIYYIFISIQCIHKFH